MIHRRQDNEENDLFKKSRRKRIVIAGGGTGGHVYPGIAIAKALQSIDPEIEVHFVGTDRGIESTVVPREGFPLHRISVGQLHSSVGILKRIKTLFTLPWSFLQSLSLCLRLRPISVLGVGGYASGPFLLISSLLGKKTFIWEPNAHPGMANRILSRFVERAYLVFESSKKLLKTEKIKQSGVPIRFSGGEERRESNGIFRILVFGGSQGARAINRAVIDAVKSNGTEGKAHKWMDGIQIIHQIGRTDYEAMKQEYEKLEPRFKGHVEVHEYLHDMDKQYQNADLVICRGGASTIAELMAFGRAAIIVPLPSAADDHQRKNAEELVKVGAAELIVQSDLTGEHLRETIQRLRSDEPRLKRMQEAILKMHRPGAAEELARDLCNI